MEYRKLGRTGLKASVIALGCEGLVKMNKKEADAYLGHAHDLGVNFIDLYSPNPVVRDHLGRVLKENRKDWIIEGHICSIWQNGQYLRTRSLKQTKEGFEDLLTRLNTNYIDVGMIHYIDEQTDYDRVFQGEIIEYVKELKANKRINAIGISSHNPAVALQAVKTGLVDVLLFSINPCYDMQPPREDVEELWNDENYKKPLMNIDPIRKELYDYCESHGIAITVMKAFGGGDLLDEKLSPFHIQLSVNQCLHYCLTRPGVVTVMAGSHSIQELNLDEAYCQATNEEKDFARTLAQVKKHSFKGNCVYCGHCAPCPKGIDVASVTKFTDLCIAQGEVPETVREHYKELKHHASECIACGACEKRCPFKVEIITKMKKAVEIFGL